MDSKAPSLLLLPQAHRDGDHTNSRSRGSSQMNQRMTFQGANPATLLMAEKLRDAIMGRSEFTAREEA
jgi:hypothetical protein